ncbi:MAG TPA: glycosyltransferase [Myxococcota bacterium]|nr:glycosyltransferase [Myxococcota bacterium]
MRFVLFYHSLVSDWNHGNAHFLRGVARELQARGHEVIVCEPRDGWSRRNLVAEQGMRPLAEFAAAFPDLRAVDCDLETLDLDALLADADVVIVHEWNPPELIERLGRHRARGGPYRLLFHDTHHRAVSAPHDIDRLALDGFDGILAFGEVVRHLYLRRGWARRAWTWHEAADVRLFRPIEGAERAGDLVWVGNWGDDERSVELETFLLEPVRRLNLAARIYGVRYPEHASRALAAAGAAYGSWLPNYRVPEVFAQFGVTVHVPRRHYMRALPGIPTIRVFEALACGIPLVSAPWSDCEGLFRPTDMLLARDGDEMARHLRAVLSDPELARALAQSGLETIRARHTCGHRVDQLLAICAELGAPARLSEVA